MSRTDRRKSARYRYVEDEHMLECSSCGAQWDYDEFYDECSGWAYCPICGHSVASVDRDRYEPDDYDYRQEEPWLYPSFRGTQW